MPPPLSPENLRGLFRGGGLFGGATEPLRRRRSDTMKTPGRGAGGFRESKVVLLSVGEDYDTVPVVDVVGLYIGAFGLD